MLAAIALVCAPQSDQRVQAWLTLLRNVARIEQASLCVDVDELVAPGQVTYEKPQGERGLDRLAAALDRSRVAIEGVHVFRRKLDEQDLRLYSPTQHAFAVISALGVTEIEKLRQGNLYLSSLPTNLRSRIEFALARSGAGVGDSMLAQYSDRTGMRLVFEPVATVMSRSGDGPVSLALLAERPEVHYPDQAASVPAEPLGRPADGTLDFQDGAVLTLRELIERAEVRFARRYNYDLRLAPARFFLSGSFTEERLIAAIDSVMEASPLVRAPDDAGTAALAQERELLVTRAFTPLADQKVGVGDLTYNDLIHGKATTFKALYGTKPPRAVESFLYRYHIQPEDVVQLSGDLYLAIAAPGLATLDSGQRDATGRPVPYSVPHFVKIQF